MTMNPKSQPQLRRKKSARSTSATAPRQPTRVAFPSIGSGTSAGGLDALEHFFHVPRNNDLALGVIQRRVVITFADLAVAGTFEAKLRERHGDPEPAKTSDCKGNKSVARPSGTPRKT